MATTDSPTPNRARPILFLVLGALLMLGALAIVVMRLTTTMCTLTITWNGGQIVQQIQPTYQTFTPNGPDCPPECRVAQVQVTLP
jgi:hypothetical protein